VNAPRPLAGSLRQSAQLVAKVAAGRSLADEFARAADHGAQASRGALLDLTHGTLRRFGRVQAIVRALSHRGASDGLLEALLWCSIYALESGRYGDHTVVDQAVAACNLLERWSAKGYVNAVLRGYLRQRGAIEARLAYDPEACHQHPLWWVDIVRAAYPERWQAVLDAGNSHPPMCVRVNRRRGSTEEYQARLAQSGISSRQIGESALLIEKPVPVDRLPGFAQGEVSVQDAGAQRAARCLDLAPGQRVLDACAAPGGKAAHILETHDVGLTALDADGERCARLERNLSRLGLAASVHAADCTAPGAWRDGASFERILADVPCSASGIARRHPDLKWLRRAQDVASFAARQAVILDALWQVLTPGGKLLYVTCSVFPGENEDVVAAFVARRSDSRRIPLPDGLPAQWLPDAEHDGFYYALIQKQA
jgi:16S rRNA (cytosine967-C5)-methyltransferase